MDGHTEAALVEKSAEVSGEPSGSSRRQRFTVGAVGAFLLAGVAGAALLGARKREELELTEHYTGASYKRRTEGPAYEIPKEVWDEARARLRMEKLKNEAIRVQAVTERRERRLAAEKEERRLAAEKASQALASDSHAAAPDRELGFDLFKMLGINQNSADDKAAAIQEHNAKQIQEHADKSAAKTAHAVADVHVNVLRDADGNKVLEDANGGDNDFNEDDEATKAALDEIHNGGNAAVAKEKFQELQMAAKKRAEQAKEEFEAKQEAREKALEAKRKIEQEKLEKELAYSKLSETKEKLETQMSAALEDEKRVLDSVSLYCFALMMPFGYEPGLLLRQKEEGVGIFRCESWAVYSNQSKMSDGSNFPFPVHEVKGPQGEPISLFVPLGGRWHTALNRDVFNQVWLEVLKVDEYRKHDWIIKIDPDSVFFPSRLKEVIGRRAPLNQVINQGSEPDKLSCEYCKKPGYEDQTCASHVHWMQSEGSSCRDALESVARKEIDCDCQCDDFACDLPSNQAMYINNCQWGLHGPIEVFSRRAIATYIAGLPICADLLPHAWGEDKFIDQCMIELGLTRVDVFDIMSEIACGDQPAPCGQSDATFHPFKEVNRWLACWHFANKYGHGPEDRIAALKVQQADILDKLEHAEKPE
eukprot:CAMPEP_0197623642 /NCGR_PEP_ID=MMETSP1338-20131121/3616_1 /TAXON_ID=43686 ORGANISM="Pelagodinium beii, Strain RCC1491" /NCGR_SAMPLE_ID=MMETSP1338 /ASSEMBLY_ACC=CAM_ASM_000754 /LENGTH=646 /DNA_ID=CAMNT_0043193683 /DNA_START=75 /DNA_END=2015 /DNA_ORIENTATION=+